MMGDKRRDKRQQHHGASRDGRPLRKSSLKGDELSKLNGRVYITYLSRLRTANRARLRGQLWNIPLIAAPVATLIVAIVSLVSDQVSTVRVEILLIIVSILTLVASIIVPSANFAATSERLFQAYRSLQRLSVNIDHANNQTDTAKARIDLAKKYDAEYQQILDTTQNHSSADYWLTAIAQNRLATHQDKISDTKDGTHAPDRASLRQVPFFARVTILGEALATLLPVFSTLLLIVILAPAWEWLNAH